MRYYAPVLKILSQQEVSAKCIRTGLYVYIVTFYLANLTSFVE